MNRLRSIAILMVVLTFSLGAQDTGVSTQSVSASQQGSVPSAFGGIELGSSYDDVFSLLQSSPLFAFRGAPDVSFLPSNGEQIIQTPGRTYIDQGVFQFRGEKLYSITIILNRDRLDYFTMYRDLTGKYGDPDYLDPSQCYWEDGGVRMVLEKPVTVKYIDMDTFNAIREESAAAESAETFSRDLFLGNF